MEAVIYEKKTRIPSFLGDRYGRVNLSNLVNVLLQVSGEQGREIDALPVSKLSLKWVIIQYDIQITRMPKTGEELRIRTFIQEHNRVFTYREFEVYDTDDNLIVYVMTVFALIDEKRKLTSIPKKIVGGYGSKQSKRVKRMPQPVPPKDDEKIKRKDYEVRYFDIDQNFHANNSMYFIWMLDVLGDEFLATHDIIEGNIVYEKEIYMNEQVESYVDFRMDDQDQLVSRHQIKVDGVSKTLANFVWESNDVDYEKDIRHLENHGVKD